MGMYTPRYDTYRIKLIGVNFKFRYIRCDDKIITDYYVQETTGVIEFVVFKSFESIEIS
jgi:hypothetical protein